MLEKAPDWYAMAIVKSRCVFNETKNFLLRHSFRLYIFARQFSICHKFIQSFKHLRKDIKREKKETYNTNIVDISILLPISLTFHIRLFLRILCKFATKSLIWLEF